MNELERYREKFESYIQKTAKCFYWTGRIDKNTGIGKFKYGKRDRNAPRIAWELENGEGIPEGMVVRQTCANSACVRPSHLEISRSTFPWRL